MQQTATKSGELIQHHLAAFSNADVNEILGDYTEESVVWTADGEIKGKEAIGAFFTEVFKIMPAGNTQLVIQQMFTLDDFVYLAWKGDSPFVHIPAAADSFLIKADKIAVQTIGAHIIPKS